MTYDLGALLAAAYADDWKLHEVARARGAWFAQLVRGNERVVGSGSTAAEAIARACGESVAVVPRVAAATDLL